MEQHHKPWVFSALPLILFSHAVAALGTPTCSQLGGAYTSSSNTYSTQCDTITVGQNFVAAYQQGDTFTQCIDRCHDNDDCTAVIYESSSGDCGLVDSYTATVSYTGYDFAAKGQTVVTTSSVAPATSSEEAQTTTSSEEAQTTASNGDVQTTSSAAIPTSESTLEPTVLTTTSATTSAEFTTFSTVLSLSTSGTTSDGTLESTLETTPMLTASTSVTQAASQTTSTLAEESSTSQYTTAASTTYRGCRPRRSLSPSIRK